MIPKSDIFSCKLQGAVGDFDSGSKKGGIFFLETFISPTQGANDFLATDLAPVRELFDLEKLDFSSVVQRDLNDARVSNGLIPYLIESTSIPFKFFPPILAVAVPVSDGQMRNSFSGKVGLEDADRSGTTFSNEIEFGSFKGSTLGFLNYRPSSLKFAIIDGQHRAMAILALYRNLVGKWGESNPFRHYYSQWTAGKVEGFDLSKIKLPVCILVMKDLFEGNATPDANIITACRKLFLDVNKNAKTVSDSTQIIMEDERITSVLTRNFLSRIKKDNAAPKIYNIQYDGSSEKYTSALPENCVTGVMHLNSTIKQMLLGRSDIFEISLAGSLNFNNNIRFREMFDFVNRFGGVANDYRDTKFPMDKTEVILEIGNEILLNDMVQFYTNFAPFGAHYQAMEVIYHKLERADSSYSFVKRLIFEGQGVRAVFDEQLTLLSELEEPLSADLKKQKEEFKLEEKKLKSEEQRVRVERLKSWLKFDFDQSLEGDALAKSTSVQGQFETIFSDVLKTQAFQMAIFVTYEQVKNELSRLGVMYTFREYVESLNGYFAVQGELSKSLTKLNGLDGSHCLAFRKNLPASLIKFVMGTKTMAPNGWHYYAYVLFEVVLAGTHKAKRDEMLEDDKSVLSRYREFYLNSEITRLKDRYIEDEGLPENYEFPKDLAKTIAKDAEKNYKASLKFSL